MYANSVLQTWQTLTRQSAACVNATPGTRADPLLSPGVTVKLKVTHGRRMNAGATAKAAVISSITQITRPKGRLSANVLLISPKAIDYGLWEESFLHVFFSNVPLDNVYALKQQHKKRNGEKEYGPKDQPAITASIRER